MQLSVYAVMRVSFTKNIRPEVDFVNGMEGNVVMMDRTGILVETITGHRPSVFPRTDAWGSTYCPMRPAYATTLMQVQGDTLARMTVWLDTPGIEAAGYVALSRAQHDADWQYVGRLEKAHFVPAEL